MRLYDEANQIVLDASHFRYLMLDGNRIRMYNRRKDEEGENAPSYSISFPSPKEAKDRFDELSEEVGWFKIRRNDIPHLLNTFCFRRFFAVENKDGTGSLILFNSIDDYSSIQYQTYKDACEPLKSLLL